MPGELDRIKAAGHVLVIRVHGAKADEFIRMRLRHADEVIVDGAHAARRNGGGVHHEAGDARRAAVHQQLVHGAAFVHGNFVKQPDGIRRALGDGVRVDMGMNVDDGHEKSASCENGDASIVRLLKKPVNRRTPKERRALVDANPLCAYNKMVYV